jgi:hypothetical protein
MRHKKIKEEAVGLLKEFINYIKKSRKRGTMPFNELKTIIMILFPKTKSVNNKLHKKGLNRGFYKHVFIIYSGRKKLVLKIGRKNRHIQKDYTTYTQLCKRLGEKKANTYFAKIYWRDGLFLLQKYGKKVNVPDKIIQKLKDETGLKDVRQANVMKFGNKYKIVDAERK